MRCFNSRDLIGFFNIEITLNGAKNLFVFVMNCYTMSNQNAMNYIASDNQYTRVFWHI